MYGPCVIRELIGWFGSLHEHKVHPHFLQYPLAVALSYRLCAERNQRNTPRFCALGNLPVKSFVA